MTWVHQIHFGGKVAAGEELTYDAIAQQLRELLTAPQITEVPPPVLCGSFDASPPWIAGVAGPFYSASAT